MRPRFLELSLLNEPGTKIFIAAGQITALSTLGGNGCQVFTGEKFYNVTESLQDIVRWADGDIVECAKR